MVVDFCSEGRIFAHTESIVFSIESGVENLIITGSAIAVLINILVDHDQIHILAVQCFHSVFAVGIGINTAERKITGIYQILLDPFLEAGTLHHSDLLTAEAFEIDDLRLGRRCKRNDLSFPIIIGT